MLHSQMFSRKAQMCVAPGKRHCLTHVQRGDVSTRALGPVPGRAQDVSSLAQQRAQLQQELHRATQAEDYKAAAAIQRSLRALEGADPLLSLQRRLAQAVQEERYEEASSLQAELQALQQAAGVWLEPGQPGGLQTSSDTVTQGVRVKVRSFYIPAARVGQGSGRYTFGYSVTISNESARVVQLRGRHWVITDGQGQQQEVRGPGVVGLQPVLLPGKAFTYESGCPLDTTTGTMEGAYTCAMLDETDGHFKGILQVRIGRFLLTTEGDIGA